MPHTPVTRLFRIALTGGIATGKTHVRRRFEEAHSVPTIDADDLTREVTKRGSEALDKIVRRFGKAILHRNGTLNRRALATVIFVNPDARQELEAILHPAVYRGIQAWFEHLEVLNRHAMAIADIPLLFETKREVGFDKVIATICPEETQIARVMARDKLTEAEARQRIAAQLPSAEKAARADYVIDTSGPYEETFAQVDKVYEALVDMASPAAAPDTPAN